MKSTYIKEEDAAIMQKTILAQGLRTPLLSCQVIME